jgi:hypothetical protein
LSILGLDELLLGLTPAGRWTGGAVTLTEAGSAMVKSSLASDELTSDE